jgi:hypothetical protein
VECPSRATPSRGHLAQGTSAAATALDEWIAGRCRDIIDVWAVAASSTSYSRGKKRTSTVWRDLPPSCRQSRRDTGGELRPEVGNLTAEHLLRRTPDLRQWEIQEGKTVRRLLDYLSL